MERVNTQSALIIVHFYLFKKKTTSTSLEIQNKVKECNVYSKSNPTAEKLIRKGVYMVMLYTGYE